jgi:hypothetical protein
LLAWSARDLDVCDRRDCQRCRQRARLRGRYDGSSSQLGALAIVLTEADRRRVERMTAYGFHLGVLATIVLLVLNHAFG